MDKLHLLHTRVRDEVYTPQNVIEPLLEFLPIEWLIWELSEATGNISNYLRLKGYDVIGTNYDCLIQKPDAFDVIISNPPYSIKTAVLRRCYEISKPFALLLPLTALEGAERQRMYEAKGLQLLLLNKRAKFIIPSGKQSPWFAVAWFTWHLLPKELVYGKVV